MSVVPLTHPRWYNQYTRDFQHEGEGEVGSVEEGHSSSSLFVLGANREGHGRGNEWLHHKGKANAGNINSSAAVI